MRRAGTIIAAIAVICALAYLSWLNPESAELHLTREWAVRAPLAVQLTLAFLLGATLLLAAAAVRASGRAVSAWRRRRREQRVARVRALEEEGRRLLWAGEPDRARTVLLRARRARANREAVLTLADACLATDNPQEARRLLQEVGNPLGDDPEILCTLAQACRRMSDTAAAISTLERGRGRYPRAARILSELRDLYLAAERWSEAAAVHAEWLGLRKRAPSPADESLLHGMRYEAAARIPGPDARLQALEEVVATAPRFLPAVVRLGDEWVAAGRTPDAVRLWEQTLRQAPHTVLAERLASAAADRSARDRVRHVFRKLRGQTRDGAALHIIAARLWIADGEPDAAQQELDAVSGTAAASRAYHGARALLGEQRGRTHEALAACRHAADAETEYRCAGCDRGARHWQAYCPSCRRWNTFRSAIELAAD